MKNRNNFHYLIMIALSSLALVSNSINFHATSRSEHVRMLFEQIVSAGKIGDINSYSVPPTFSDITAACPDRELKCKKIIWLVLNSQIEYTIVYDNDRKIVSTRKLEGFYDPKPTLYSELYYLNELITVTALITVIFISLLEFIQTMKIKRNHNEHRTD